MLSAALKNFTQNHMQLECYICLETLSSIHGNVLFQLNCNRECIERIHRPNFTHFKSIYKLIKPFCKFHLDFYILYMVMNKFRTGILRYRIYKHFNRLCANNTLHQYIIFIVCTCHLSIWILRSLIFPHMLNKNVLLYTLSKTCVRFLLYYLSY